MALSLALNTALTGLNVNKRVLDEIAQNIANANTKDYSRKVTELSSVYVDGNGAGVRIDDVSRKVDAYLTRTIQQQSGNVAMNNIMSEYSERIQVMLGKPGNADSIDAFITKFFSSLQTLAETPERGSLKLDSVNQGSLLARQVSTLAKGLEDLRYQADQEISQTISRVNTNLDALYKLNISISDAYSNGRPLAELHDKRDTLVRNLSEDLDISYYYTPTTEVRISTNSGIALLDGSRYQLQYSKLPSPESLVISTPVAPINVYLTSVIDGSFQNAPQILATGGAQGEVGTTMASGSIKALMDLRDNKIPAILEQLDNLAANIRDVVNAVHNSGTGYPGSVSYTGTRLVNGTDMFEWSGSARFALVYKNGQPIPSPYPAEPGFLPLTLDFGSLNSGSTNGKPTVQTIIDEINTHFHQPQNKAALGGLSNIRLRSDSNSLPGTPAQFKFDFDVENVSGEKQKLFMTGVTILNDAGADITSTTDTLPSFALASTNTYVTTLGSNMVTINTTGAHGLAEGQYIYLPNPGTTVDGIPASQFTGIFQVSSVTATSFQIQVTGQGAAGGATNVASLTGRPEYIESQTGTMERTRDSGIVTASLSGQTTSIYYTVRATFSVVEEDGSTSTGTMDYKVFNGVGQNLNAFYGASAVSGASQLFTPNVSSPLLTATLVDAQGNEIPKDSNGKYVNTSDGYLKLASQNSNYFLSMDALDSKQLGLPSDSPPTEGTNRSFQHYFELNNFFKNNAPTDTGETLKNSAYNMAVESRLISNPNLITTGSLVLSPTPTGINPPRYTYEKYNGDNTIAQALAALATQRVNFNAAGGLGETAIDFNGYSGEILGYISAEAASAESARESAETLLAGFTQRQASVSGVNLDEELANTIIYQNSYTATARIITVTNQLFEALLNAYG